jgi:hypothetical protein
LLREGTSLLVLVKHHGDRTLVSGQAGSLQLGKQQVLFLAVVTGIREQADEGHTVADRFEVQSVRTLGAGE